jgi:hypothetical protein
MKVADGYQGTLRPQQRRTRTRRTRFLLSMLLIIVSSILAYQLFRSQTSGHQGKSLDDWLNQYANNISMDPQSDEAKSATYEARNAIREIGTNALPYLITLVKAHDSSFKVKVIMLLQKQSFMPWHPRTAADYHRMAGAGFEALGSSAAPTVDMLTGLLDNPDAGVRVTAAAALQEIGPSAKSAVPSLLRHLGDKDLNVTLRCITALSEVRQCPETVVPALAALIGTSKFGSQQPIVTLISINAVAAFGSQAKAAVPAIRAHLNDNDFDIRASATDSLMTIDPDSANESGLK